MLKYHVVTPVYFLVLVMTLFMMAVEVRSPLIMESITVPCLKILLRLVKPPPPNSKTNKVLIPLFYCIPNHPLRRVYEHNALYSSAFRPDICIQLGISEMRFVDV